MARPIATGKQAGFTYLGVLIGVAILGATLAALGTVWHTLAQREQEKELLFIGQQFRMALSRYHQNNQRYPMRLEQLVQDDSRESVRRYLRRIYVDPMTRRAHWGVLTKADGQIVGVYSLSTKVPLKQAGFRPQDADFAQRNRYSEWLFIADGQIADVTIEAPRP